MARDLTKKEQEFRIFEALAPLADITVVPGSIIQAQPPAPDIQCDVVGLGHMNFELLALDNEVTRKRLSNMFNTTNAWTDSLRGLSPEELARVHKEFANVHLSLLFDEMAGTRDRSAAMSAIQKELLSLPSGYSGSLFTDLTLPARLHSVSVFRNNRTDGPQVSAPSAGYWMPPQLTKIEEKLRQKNYSCVGPLELFAYSTHDEPDGHINSLEELQACINQNLADSRFSRVHVFHVGFLKHIITVVRGPS